jgi:hypothetical protein
VNSHSLKHGASEPRVFANGTNAGKISLDFFRVLKVTSILELMQRQAGAIVGPIQSHRLATREAFATSVGTSKTGYKDRIEQLYYLKDGQIVNAK